ncbi:ABC transporter ATP-binding protein [Spiroplasma helicoides]|uniref:ABC transporter ATP-binding protein n=1 Tax=Spiroplasma helicoides TaxID=216938 RepID=A0A1B3SKI2_9MOLU|nr:ABC transporter ATP-binding protein [Spiroplasma helicoides]AOG60433.1 ABC transporter ATP-binding protein [Spiroplasma helicoides]
MLEIINLTKMFDKHSGIKDVNLKLDKGVYGLLGKNGSGKSTLLKLIASIIHYKKGDIVINGLSNKNNKFDLKNIAYISAEQDLPMQLSIQKFFKFVREFNDDIKDTFDEVAAALNFDINSTKLISQLSTGMLQKLKICIAFGYPREIYLLDEITLGLDPVSTDQIISFIKNFSKDALVIYSSHKLEEVEALCSKAIVLRNNKVETIFNVDENSEVITNYRKVFKREE